MTRPRGPVDARHEARNARIAAACGWVAGVYTPLDARDPSPRAGWVRGACMRQDAADYDDDAHLYDLLSLAADRGWDVRIELVRHGWLEVHLRHEGRWAVAYGASGIGVALASAVADGLELDAQVDDAPADEDDHG